MNTFFIDGARNYGYSGLIEEICREPYYYPLYRTSDIYACWKNLLKALVSGRPITLLDSDVNPSEMADVDIALLDKRVEIGSRAIETIGQLTDIVKKSEAEITLFTSGTTGRPKKIVHTVASLTRTVRAGEKYRDNIWGFAYNPTHIAGLQVFFQAFENACTLINLFGKNRTEIHGIIRCNRITHLSATPTFYRLLLPAEESFPCVERATLGGERSDGTLYESIRKMFPNARINNIYASTEAGSLFFTEDDRFRIPESIRDRIKVSDNELLIHRSLLGTSESLSLDGEYYHSGDIIEWADEERGTFRFVSRKNEMINVGGYKVNPEEVENALLSIPGIRQALVYGRSSSVLGNVICADIVSDDDCRMDAIGIRKELQGVLQDFKIPRRIKFVETLPLTRTGKLKRS